MSVLEVLERIACALERAHPRLCEPEFDALAFRWEPAAPSRLKAIKHAQLISFAELKNLERQAALIDRNTAHFVAGKVANHVLLTGARGTGKSSLVKACLQAYQAQGLRLIELDRAHLQDLPDLIELVANRPERFIVFCDDLSFDEGDSAYKGLKSALDGSVGGPGDNVLIYATSNRRHLLAQRSEDNLSVVRSESGELHPGETIEERVSLSERFGLWIGFYPFSQDQYLEAVAHWLKVYANVSLTEHSRQAAINWATQRGSRSGRVAMQFARDYAISCQ